MAKPYTFPTKIEELKAIRITRLKQDGYLDPDRNLTGSLNWTCNGEPSGSITISTYMTNPKPYFEVSYRINQIPIRYKIPLVSIPSNLGKGIIWYFICPKTQKRCRKLHLVGSYFYHRTAFNCLYEKQT